MSSPWAIARYQAIAAYVAGDPPRGRRRALLEHPAKRTWPGCEFHAIVITDSTAW